VQLTLKPDGSLAEERPTVAGRDIETA